MTVYHFENTPRYHSQPARWERRLRLKQPRQNTNVAGFSLVEIMISLFVFSLMAAGILAVMLKSYQFSSEARYRDEARAILTSYSDQFLRLSVTSGTGSSVEMFTPTLSGPTQRGLVWGRLNNKLQGTPQDIPEWRLGGAEGFPATVTRDVRYLHPVTLQAVEGVAPIPAPGGIGFLIRGTFEITYVHKGRTIRQSVVVLRFVG